MNLEGFFPNPWQLRGQSSKAATEPWQQIFQSSSLLSSIIRVQHPSVIMMTIIIMMMMMMIIIIIIIIVIVMIINSHSPAFINHHEPSIINHQNPSPVFVFDVLGQTSRPENIARAHVFHKYIHTHMCRGLNSHLFPVFGDGHQPNRNGSYTC